MLAPNVAIYTAGHPVHYIPRNTGYEYGIDITIGDNVWIGGNVVITPGVKVGNGVVIGAGSVVTKDIPRQLHSRRKSRKGYPRNNGRGQALLLQKASL